MSQTENVTGLFLLAVNCTVANASTCRCEVVQQKHLSCITECIPALNGQLWLLCTEIAFIVCLLSCIGPSVIILHRHAVINVTHSHRTQVRMTTDAPQIVCRRLIQLFAALNVQCASATALYGVSVNPSGLDWCVYAHTHMRPKGLCEGIIGSTWLLNPCLLSTLVATRAVYTRRYVGSVSASCLFAQTFMSMFQSIDHACMHTDTSTRIGFL